MNNLGADDKPSFAARVLDMIRIMLDSNVHDEVIAVPGFADRLRAAKATGHIEIVTTHVQQDELQRIPDPEKRAAALDVPGTVTATAGAVWGVSQWDQAKWGEGTSDITYTDISNGNPRHAEDALIAITAATEADVLVTQEKTLLKRIAATGSKLVVWNFAQLARHIDALKIILFAAVLVGCTQSGLGPYFERADSKVVTVEDEEFKVQYFPLDTDRRRFSTRILNVVFFKWIGGGERYRKWDEMQFQAAKTVIAEECGAGRIPSVYGRKRYENEAALYVDFECAEAPR